MTTCMVIASSVWQCTVSNGRTKSGGTHVKDVKDPVEVQPPGGDCLFVALRVEKTTDRISFAPALDDVPLDLGHSPAVEISVSESPNVHIVGSTHVANC